jgi:hypothetical protein
MAILQKIIAPILSAAVAFVALAPAVSQARIVRPISENDGHLPGLQSD